MGYQPSPDKVSVASDVSRSGEKAFARTQNALQKGRPGEFATAEVLAVESEHVGPRHRLCVSVLFLKVDRKKLRAAQFRANAQERFGTLMRADGQRGREGFATTLSKCLKRAAERVSETALAPFSTFGGALNSRCDHLPPLFVVWRVDKHQNPFLIG